MCVRDVIGCKLSGLMRWGRTAASASASASALRPHLHPLGVPVEYGAEAPEAAVGPVGPVNQGLGLCRLQGADVVRGLVRLLPPQLTEVGKGQLPWLKESI